jgi:Zn-finger in ubiquitin-hydrolases and other protein
VLRRHRGGPDEPADERHDKPLRLFRQLVRSGQLPIYEPELCEHLGASPARDIGRPSACEDHLPTDEPVVHLRTCLTCGHVACCDSSQPRHATKHAHKTGHPVIQSAEAGESWRWCYPDELLG